MHFINNIDMKKMIVLTFPHWNILTSFSTKRNFNDVGKYTCSIAIIEALLWGLSFPSHANIFPFPTMSSYKACQQQQSNTLVFHFFFKKLCKTLLCCLLEVLCMLSSFPIISCALWQVYIHVYVRLVSHK